VDIKATREGGYAVGWFQSGDVLAYDIRIPAEAFYTFTARIGSNLPNRTFDLEIDGVIAAAAVQVPQLPEWDQFENVPMVRVALAAGPHRVKIIMGPLDYMDYNWFEVTR